MIAKPPFVRLGLAMDGLENQMEDLVVNQICRRFGEITYLEIGVGHGGTLAGVAQIIRGCGGYVRWRVIGVELSNGYSYDESEVKRSMQIRHLQVRFMDTLLFPANPGWGEITVYLKDSQTFVPSFWREPVQLALIDGCHGKPCVMGDFLHIEPHIVPGGYVMFHDFGVDQTGAAQVHCPALDVRGAVDELGLTNGRAGWEFVGEWIGEPGIGANMGVFKKL